MKRLISKSARASAMFVLAVGLISAVPMFADEADDDQHRNNNGEGVSDEGCSNNCVDRPQGSHDATRMSGEVLAINTLVEPHEIILGNVDGRVVVKLIGKDAPYLVRQSGVKVRDYVEVSGQKEHEGLFWADTISERDDND